MFNTLNTWIQEGTNPPMVCKFLDSLSAFSHGNQELCKSPCYLLERMDLRACLFATFGFRIAFPIGEPGLNRIRRGKD
jgi:hypothetical protein